MHPDQAATLRAWAQERANPHRKVAAEEPKDWPSKHGPVMAVVSGSSGTGKTAVVSNLAASLVEQGLRILTLSADRGASGLNLAFGVDSPQHTLLDVWIGRVHLSEAIVDAPGGVQVVPAPFGAFDMGLLPHNLHGGLLEAMQTLEQRFDMLLIDTTTGLSGNTLVLTKAANQLILVMDAKPTALAETYAFAKSIHRRLPFKRIDLVVNRVRSVTEGEDLYDRMATVIQRFLGVHVGYLGSIADDYWVSRARSAARPLQLFAPQSAANQCMQAMAAKLQRWSKNWGDEQMRNFWQRLCNRGAMW